MMNPASPEPESKSIFKNPLLYSSAVILVVIVYVGWIFYTRRQETKALEQRKAEEQREVDQKTVDLLGGTSLEIRSFYGSPGLVQRGGSAQLCYDVSNAKNVKLDPPVASVWPSHTRCFEVTPTKDTTYTLTIDDGGGHTKTASLEIKVR